MVYMFLANGFEETEALCTLDLIRRAGIDVVTVGIDGDMIQGSHHITVAADIPAPLYRDPRPEAVILPGGMPGTNALDASGTVDAALNVAAKNGGLLCAICAAPMILGKRGYLQGKRAVCYPGFEKYLAGAAVADTPVVTDGNIITASSMGAAYEFGLAIVAALRGKEKAEAIRSSSFPPLK